MNRSSIQIDCNHRTNEDGSEFSSVTEIIDNIIIPIIITAFLGRCNQTPRSDGGGGS